MVRLPPCLVLAAGLGTRLRPLTWLRAKPALPVAGVPLVGRILRWLAGAGVDRAVLNLHYLPDTVRAAVDEWGPPGMRVGYSHEVRILGSAGGPKRALPLLGAPRILVVNGDTLTGVDLGQLLAAHESSGALVTMAVVENREPARYGGVVAGADRGVAGFVPRGSRERSWHFVGVQVLDAAALDRVPDDEPFESVSGLYPALLRERPGSVRIFPSDAVFHDVGTPSDYLATSIALSRGDDLALRGPRARVAPGARVARSILWEDVTVQDAASLRDCIVTDGVSVPAGSTFSRQVLISERVAAAIPGENGARAGRGVVVFPLEPRAAG